MTDFKHMQVRDLHLYIRPLEGKIVEAVVLDNELAIYHTSVDDIALRKSPYWQEIFSISNIRKIMNDKDVIISKGKESLKRLHANALALLDLTYSQDDMMLLLEDARLGLDQKSIAQVQESLDLFVGLLDFQPVSFKVPGPKLQVFAKPEFKVGAVSTFKSLILFDEKKMLLGLKEGPFSPDNNLDVAWVMQYARGEKSVELQGMAVFEFLSELAFKNTRVP